MSIVPKFLLRRLYQKGSLRTTDDGIAFDLKNILGPGIIQRIVHISLNDYIFKPSDIKIQTNGKLIKCDHITPDSPVLFTFLQKGTCLLKGHPPIQEGKNELCVELISREAGQISVTISDKVDVREKTDEKDNQEEKKENN